EIDLRYTGQGYELRTPLDGLFNDQISSATLQAARQRFDERHAQIHGHSAPDRSVEVVSYRLRVRVAVPRYQAHAEQTGTLRSPGEAIKGERRLMLQDAEGVQA